MELEEELTVYDQTEVVTAYKTTFEYDENGTLISSQECNILTGQRATLGVIRN